jgi:hypothetical protein
VLLLLSYNPRRPLESHREEKVNDDEDRRKLFRNYGCF